MKLFHNFLPLNHFSENYVLSIQPRTLHKSDEELRTIGMGSCIGHREEVRLIVSVLKTLIFKLAPVYGPTSTPILVSEVTSLGNVVLNDAMERGSFVPKTFFTCAESPEVFRGYGDILVEEFESDSPFGDVVDADIEIDS